MSVVPPAQRRAAAITSALVVAALVLAVVAISLPNGGRASAREATFAFTSNREGSVDLYVTSSPGTLPRRLTHDQAVDGDPTWAPDGSQMVFASERDGNLDLFLIGAGGGATERLTDHPAADLHPAWSPDGRKLAFTSERYNDFVPDYDGNAEIVVLDLDTRRITRITHHPADDTFPAWSPDGQELVFASQRGGSFNLYIVSVGGGDPRQITQNTGTSWQAAWAPDGSRIAFAYVPSGFALRDVAWISLVEPDGTNLVRVTEEFRGDFDPSWSPDSSRLVFVSTRDGSRQLYTMSVTGSAVEWVDAGQGNASDPVWQP